MNSSDRIRLGSARLSRLMAGGWKKGSIPDKWDGHAGERIVSTLERLLQ